MEADGRMETNVLVVDDSVVVRTVLKDHLEAHGYHVLLASDGVEALDLYHQNDVHILIADLEMPRMDGLELCWLVRADDDQHRTFCILMTADDDVLRRIEAFDSGADDFLIKPIELPMLRARVRSGERLTRSNRLMAEMLSTDYLTGVLNRRHFMDQLERRFRKARESGASIAVAMFDIDHFKRVNDTLGHSNGDLALKRFAALCAEHCPAGGVIGRMGGEEFCMVLPSDDPPAAIARADSVRLATADTTVTTADGREVSFTVSVGVCLADGVDSVPDLLSRADEALYFAKNSGRNRTVVCGTGGVVVAARYYVM